MNFSPFIEEKVNNNNKTMLRTRNLFLKHW